MQPHERARRNLQVKVRPALFHDGVERLLKVEGHTEPLIGIAVRGLTGRVLGKKRGFLIPSPAPPHWGSPFLYLAQLLRLGQALELLE